MCVCVTAAIYCRYAVMCISGERGLVGWLSDYVCVVHTRFPLKGVLIYVCPNATR